MSADAVVEGSPPWHRRAAWAALALASLGMLTLAFTLLVAVGEARGATASEAAWRRGVLDAGELSSIGLFGASLALAIRALRPQPLAAWITVLVSALGLAASIGFALLAHAS